MLQYKWLNVAVAIVTCILQAQCADKYTDENRPYEFGFKIGEEQHRHEKKDENGLIMGEFGFITADGVYHVTVYATDENGNFKILSMKNIRVKPYPSGLEKKAPVSEKKGHSLPFPPSQNPPQTQGPSPPEPSSSLPGPVAAAPTKTCSSCSIPTTTTRRPQLTDLAVVSKDKTSQFDVSAPSSNQNPQGKPSYPGQNANGGPVRSEPQYPQGGSDQNYPQQGAPGQRYPQQGIPGQNYPHQGVRPGENYPQAPITEQQDYAHAGVGTPSDYPQMGSNYPEGIQPPGQTLQTPLGTNGGERSPKKFEYPQQGQASQEDGPQGGNVGGFGPEKNERPNKPTLVSAQMQIVDKNTDIHHKKPGEKDGLPDGITKDDMVRLLYTFNYTVGFHGHFEEGYTNGVKQGYYFVTGRNGVRTRVDYVADENGFRPKITQEVLDLISEDVPKPETEKDEKYGLKGYEFKWLYYPVGSSRR